MEQMDLVEYENLESKNDVFYVRCRPRIKALLLTKMAKDGFNSMADWFDQWVPKMIGAKNVSNKKRISKRSRKAKKSGSVRR